MNTGLLGAAIYHQCSTNLGMTKQMMDAGKPRERSEQKDIEPRETLEQKEVEVKEQPKVKKTQEKKKIEELY